MSLNKIYKIRLANFGDAASIFKIGTKLFTSYGMEDWTFSAVAEHLEDYPKFCLSAIENKKVVGFLLARPYENSKTRFYIYWVAVSPKFQGKGIGLDLLDRITEIARKNGFKKIIIDTQRNNWSMQKILKQSGFKKVEEEIFFIKKISELEK